MCVCVCVCVCVCDTNFLATARIIENALRIKKKRNAAGVEKRRIRFYLLNPLSTGPQNLISV